VLDQDEGMMRFLCGNERLVGIEAKKFQTELCCMLVRLMHRYDLLECPLITDYKGQLKIPSNIK
jgi:hypothetical protein